MSLSLSGWCTGSLPQFGQGMVVYFFPVNIAMTQVPGAMHPITEPSSLPDIPSVSRSYREFCSETGLILCCHPPAVLYLCVLYKAISLLIIWAG